VNRRTENVQCNKTNTIFCIENQSLILKIIFLSSVKKHKNEFSPLNPDKHVSMKKIILSLFSLLIIMMMSKQSNAQNYQTALGLKFGGFESGVCFKYFATNTVSLEGDVGFRSGGAVFTGYYQVNMVAFNVPALKFYYGAGAHIGSEGGGTYQTFGGQVETYNSAHILLGVDGVIGLEYLIPKSPIAISIDLEPRAELASGPYFDLAPALGLKYAFGGK
jgi:hypothetical protein